MLAQDAIDDFYVDHYRSWHIGVDLNLNLPEIIKDITHRIIRPYIPNIVQVDFSITLELMSILERTAKFVKNLNSYPKCLISQNRHMLLQ